MLRRLAAVGVLTLGSLTFAFRFTPPPATSEELEAAADKVEVEPPPPSTIPRFSTLPTITTTTTTLPPGVHRYESGFVRFGRGVLQLEVTLEDGVITDIEMIKTPHRSVRARETNTGAHPMLRAEAMEIQHYQVHVVSGATETSIGWARALRDALEQADFCFIVPKSRCDLPLS